MSYWTYEETLSEFRVLLQGPLEIVTLFDTLITSFFKRGIRRLSDGYKQDANPEHLFGGGIT